MKTWLYLITFMFVLSGCSSHRTPANFSGADRQEAHEEKLRQEQETHFRNQFPGARAF